MPHSFCREDFIKIPTLIDILKNNHFSKNQKNPKASNNPKELFDFINLVEDWRTIVGEKLAEHTIPLKLTYRQLTVLTNHPTFAQHLSLLEEEIKKNITKHFTMLAGKIDRIVFQHKPTLFNEQRLKTLKKDKIKQNQRPHPASPLFIKLAAEAADIFKEIEDQETKRLLIDIYIQTRYFQNGGSSS